MEKRQAKMEASFAVTYDKLKIEGVKNVSLVKVKELMLKASGKNDEYKFKATCILSSNNETLTITGNATIDKEYRIEVNGPVDIEW